MTQDDKQLVERLEAQSWRIGPGVNELMAEAAARIRQLVEDRDKFMELYDAARCDVVTLQIRHDDFAALQGGDRGE